MKFQNGSLSVNGEGRRKYQQKNTIRKFKLFVNGFLMDNMNLDETPTKIK